MSPAALLTFLALTVLSETEAMRTAKSSDSPTYKFRLEKLIIPTLVTISIAVARVTRATINKYSATYANTFLKHLENETEVQLVNGDLTGESKVNLNILESEMEVLQYRKCHNNILEPWAEMLGGQPVEQDVANQINKYARNIVLGFEVFIYELQTRAIDNRRQLNNSICKSVCKNSTRILNLTKSKIPDEITKALANGINLWVLSKLKRL